MYLQEKYIYIIYDACFGSVGFFSSLRIPKYIVFNKVLSKQNVNIHLTHDFLYMYVWGRGSPGISESIRLADKCIIPDCIVAIFPVIDCWDIYTCIYIYEENGFLLVCTWSARVTCMNDRTDVTVRCYIYDLHVKITFNDIYVPRNA